MAVYIVATFAEEGTNRLVNSAEVLLEHLFFRSLLFLVSDTVGHGNFPIPLTGWTQKLFEVGVVFAYEWIGLLRATL